MPRTVASDWIDSREKLDQLLQGVSPPSLLAIDTEFMRRNTFYPQLALLQLDIGGHTALIDPLAFQPAEPLTTLMESPDTCCIMHSASEDMEALAELLPHGPAQLFDTQIAAAMTGLGPGLSYQKLVHQLIGEEVDKGETRSDWLQRPLTDSQCDYAALDVAYLHAIHEQLHARLEELGRLEWLHEDCQRLCHRAERDRIDPQPQRSLAAAAEWSPEEQALLRRLLLWRERTARKLDKPRPWLFKDNQALNLVSHRPANLDQLREAMRGQRAMRSAQCKDLLEELQRPLEADELESTAAIPPPLQRGQRGALKALQQAVHALAEELDIPPGLLCPRRLLEELLATGDWPDMLHGWRRPVLELHITPLLAH